MPRRQWTDPTDSKIRPHRWRVPDDLAAKLRRASEKVTEALDERDRLIVYALKRGSSTREIGAHVGLSQTQVRRIASDAGWPSEAEKKKRAAEAEQRKQERAEMDDLIGTLTERPEQ